MGGAFNTHTPVMADKITTRQVCVWVCVCAPVYCIINVTRMPCLYFFKKKSHILFLFYSVKNK